MATSDAALLEAARTGDRGAVDELLARYEPSIYRFGLRMCGDEDAAREVLQETMLAAFRGVQGFRGDASISTWLYQIARSFCIKQRRGVRPAEPLDAALVDGGASPEHAAHAREIGDALSAAIATLPDDQREALLLRDVEGLTADEAARAIGIEVGALKSRLHRARLALRRRLIGVLDTEAAAPCPELAQTLAAYAAAEIDRAACEQLEAHLHTCARCTAACDALKRTVALCKALPGTEVPSAVRAAIRTAIAEVVR